MLQLAAALPLAVAMRLHLLLAAAQAQRAELAAMLWLDAALLLVSLLLAADALWHLAELAALLPVSLKLAADALRHLAELAALKLAVPL